MNAAASTGAGTYSFTAANGDVLTADFTGIATATDKEGVVSIAESAVITGGTGRFAGARGSFRADRVFDFGTGLTEGSFDGVLILAK